jgi:hypothetical protein
MRKLMTPGLVLAGWLLGASAEAHEGGAHSLGTVKEIAADRIVLGTKDGKEVVFPMTAGTRIVRGHQPIRPADVHPGERAVVHATTRDGKLEAVEVRVAEGPK